MIHKAILIFSILLFLSCAQRTVSDNSYATVQKLYGEFVIEKKEAKLKKAYTTLIAIDDFKTNGITPENMTVVIPVYMKMKKYMELASLLDKGDDLPEYEAVYISNLCKGLAYRCSDKDSSDVFFRKNANHVKACLEKEPLDSTKLVDYYINQLYLTSLDSVLAEIEVKRAQPHTGISTFFYDEVLKEAVIEYEKETPACK